MQSLISHTVMHLHTHTYTHTYTHTHTCTSMQCNELYFPLREREALARTIVRHHDAEHLYHCPMKQCGEDCLFLSVHGPNKPCPVVYSSCWKAKHDALCPQKVVPCTRQCGEEMARMLVENHREFSCPLRSAIILVSKTLPSSSCNSSFS